MQYNTLYTLTGKVVSYQIDSLLLGTIFYQNLDLSSTLLTGRYEFSNEEAQSILNDLNEHVKACGNHVDLLELLYGKKYQQNVSGADAEGLYAFHTSKEQVELQPVLSDIFISAVSDMQIDESLEVDASPIFANIKLLDLAKLLLFFIPDVASIDSARTYLHLILPEELDIEKEREIVRKIRQLVLIESNSIDEVLQWIVNGRNEQTRFDAIVKLIKEKKLPSQYLADIQWLIDKL